MLRIFALVFACTSILAVDASASIADLVSAIRSKQEGRVQKAFEKLLESEPGRFPTKAAMSSLKTSVNKLATDPKSETDETVVNMICDLLALRQDTALGDIVPDVLELMGKGPEKTSIALEQLLQRRTNHSPDIKADGWPARVNGWKSIWSQVKSLDHPKMMLRGFKQAGLKLPPAAKSDKAMDDAVNELIKGLSHTDMWIRGNAAQMLSIAMQPKRFEFDPNGPKHARAKALNEIKEYWEANKVNVRKKIKEMLEPHVK